MSLILRSKSKIFLFIGSIIIYNEFLCYTLHSIFKWPSITCNEKSDCVKIVLVADPQILGENFEPCFPVGSLARWDSDRFLSKTFDHVVSHVSPDVIVFLGDIMNEMTSAHEEEFRRYSERFSNIFQRNRSQWTYIPGNSEIRDGPYFLPDYKRVFFSTFNLTDNFTIKSVNFYKFDYYFSPENPLPIGEYRTNVVLTHHPLLLKPNRISQEVVEHFRPQVIFSTHHHKSKHINASAFNIWRTDVEILSPSGGPIWLFQLNKTHIHEIMVPTCSYRMGATDVGYGVAVIDNSGSMLYSVLWSPSRLLQLEVYIGVLILILFWLSCRCYCDKYIRNKRMEKKYLYQ